MTQVKKLLFFSPVRNSSHQNSINNYFPKISVANQKAFRNVNSSPVKSGIVEDFTKKPSTSQRPTSSKISPKNSLKAVELTPVTASQNMSGPEDEVPSKRCRLEDKTVLDKFFIKKEQLPSGDDPKCSFHPAAATQNSSGSSSQSKMVNCPVCQNEVLESQINEHLDLCLEADSIKVKT